MTSVKDEATKEAAAIVPYIEMMVEISDSVTDAGAGEIALAIVHRLMEDILEGTKKHSVMMCLNKIEPCEEHPDGGFSIHTHFNYQEAPVEHFCVELS